MKAQASTAAIALVAAAFYQAAFADDAVVPADWITIKAGKHFTFRAPPDTEPYSDGGKPIDSFVGLYRNSQFTLGFDYGLYSNNLASFRANPDYAVETTQIDGRNAVIVTGPGRNAWGCNHYVSAVYLVVSRSWLSGNTVRLQMEGCTKRRENLPLIHATFKSLQL